LPSRVLGWKSPLEVMQMAVGIPNPCSNIGYLRIYGC